jgi:hypothetical protein
MLRLEAGTTADELFLTAYAGDSGTRPRIIRRSGPGNLRSLFWACPRWGSARRFLYMHPEMSHPVPDLCSPSTPLGERGQTLERASRAACPRADLMLYLYELVAPAPGRGERLTTVHVPRIGLILVYRFLESGAVKRPLEWRNARDGALRYSAVLVPVSGGCALIEDSRSTFIPVVVHPVKREIELECPECATQAKMLYLTSISPDRSPIQTGPRCQACARLPRGTLSILSGTYSQTLLTRGLG